jgi:ATP-dependent exoDNAse (exonuclease V) alpha subunit
VKTSDNQGVSVERMNGETAMLPLDMAARFQVYESRQIALAAGDWIRITQNGFTKDRHRLNNGDLKQVKGITKDGDIKLVNGWVISKDYGNLTHGYCLTSYSSQSKGVDCVFVAEGSESFHAADREQFYVSASRFKDALTIYTDDKHQLLEAVGKSSHRPSAMDLVTKGISESASETSTKKPLPLEDVRNIQKLMLAKQKTNSLRNQQRRSIKI